MRSAAAQRAYASWRLVPAPRRAEILFRAAQIIAERKEQFARDMTREMGKVLEETRGDVQEAIDMTYFMAGEGRRHVRPDGAVRAARQVRDVGAPADGRLLGHHAVELPDGDSVVEDHARARLRQHGGVQACVADAALGDQFRRGARGGRACRRRGESRHRRARRRNAALDATTASRWSRSPVRRRSAASSIRTPRPAFKKVHLEMGGKNVIMIMDDAQLELAVEGCLWGGFGTTGQRCTAASRVVVHEKVYDAFRRGVCRARKALRVGNGLDEGVQMGPSVSEAQLATVMRYVEIGKQEGATPARRRPSADDGRSRAKGFSTSRRSSATSTRGCESRRRRFSVRSSR